MHGGIDVTNQYDTKLVQRKNKPNEPNLTFDIKPTEFSSLLPHAKVCIEGVRGFRR